jgi:hypothetical protein
VAEFAKASLAGLEYEARGVSFPGFWLTSFVSTAALAAMERDLD